MVANLYTTTPTGPQCGLGVAEGPRVPRVFASLFRVCDAATGHVTFGGSVGHLSKPSHQTTRLERDALRGYRRGPESPSDGTTEKKVLHETTPRQTLAKNGKRSAWWKKKENTSIGTRRSRDSGEVEGLRAYLRSGKPPEVVWLHTWWSTHNGFVSYLHHIASADARRTQGFPGFPRKEVRELAFFRLLPQDVFVPTARREVRRVAKRGDPPQVVGERGFELAGEERGGGSGTGRTDAGARCTEIQSRDAATRELFAMAYIGNARRGKGSAAGTRGEFRVSRSRGVSSTRTVAISFEIRGYSVRCSAATRAPRAPVWR